MKSSHIVVVSTVSALVVGALIGRPAIDTGVTLLSGRPAARPTRAEPKTRSRSMVPSSAAVERSSAVAPAALAPPPAAFAPSPSTSTPYRVPASGGRAQRASSNRVGSRSTAGRRPSALSLSSSIPVSSGWDLSALASYEYGGSLGGGLALTELDGSSLAAGAGTELTPPEALPRGMVMLAGLRPAWPNWFTPTVDLQARGETASALQGDASRAFLSRARVGGTVTATSWAKATFVVQDAREFGRGNSLASNPVDLFEAFGELTAAGGRAGVRVGRQRLELGAERLVGDSDWTALSRSADGVSGWWGSGLLTVRAFAAQVVEIDSQAADPWWSDRRLAAFSATVSNARGTRALAPYVLMSRREGGADSRYTLGTQVEHSLGASVRVDAEVAWQRGESFGEPVAATTGHYGLTWRDAAALGRTSLGVEFDHASGDRDPGDGRRQTFDPIAPDTGERFGLVDVVQASNLRHLGVRLAFEPTPRTDIALVYHRLFTDTVADATYAPNGAVSRFSGVDPSSRDIGTSFDVRGQWRASRLTVIHFGLATFFGGPRTDEGGGRERTWRPYAGWRVSF